MKRKKKGGGGPLEILGDRGSRESIYTRMYTLQGNPREN